MTALRLRLFHTAGGVRVAYREAGTGPALVLLHSQGLTHREFEPAVEHLVHRFRVVLPDLPLHGDSEDRPRHPYTLEWFAETMSAFCLATAGARPLVGGHGMGAEIVLHAAAAGQLDPGRLVLMPNRMHRIADDPPRRRAWRAASRMGVVPGLDRVVSHTARHLVGPGSAEGLTARGDTAARDLLRHAVADVGGNAGRARAVAGHLRAWPRGPRRELLDAYPTITARTLLLWADEDATHPLTAAREALDLLPDADLRVLPATGFLLAYDDPVAVARELISFCG